MDTHGTTDVGRQRSENQDAIYHGTVGDGVLLAVADGMGGHAGGTVASRVAIDAFVTAAREHCGDESPEDALTDAVAAANEAVLERATEDPALSGMGTTLVAALVCDPVDDACRERDAEGARDAGAGNEAILVNVGDSRAYEVGDGIEQLTVDQSLVQELVEAGDLDPDDAEDHPHSNVLSQSLGTDESVDPDVYRRSITGTLLLCSDGLTGELADEAIAEVVRGSDLADAVETLVERANEAGGGDNVSVVLGRGGDRR
jgi:protein phosphatase